MTVVVHYTGNEKGLVALLVNLQPQLAPLDDIYIVDSTEEHSGLKLATLYGTTRCYIFVEVNLYTFEDALSAGFQSCMENSQDGALILSESTILPQTFISNLKKAIKISNGEYGVLVPQVIKSPYDRMDSNFQWFNPATDKLVKVNPTIYNYLTPGCAYVSKETLALEKEEDRANIKVGIFGNERVLVLPYTPFENRL